MEKMGQAYDVKPFNLYGLNGISDRTLEMHVKVVRRVCKGREPTDGSNRLDAQRWTD
jgi:hypothetical protein